MSVKRYVLTTSGFLVEWNDEALSMDLCNSSMRYVSDKDYQALEAELKELKESIKELSEERRYIDQ